MSLPASISILVPTKQGEEFLGRQLDALAAQETSIPWDLRYLDSGSTDRTLGILAERCASFPVPLVVEEIHPVEFDHGDTRNELAARSRGELLVYLTQDAIPIGTDWLQRLAENFTDPGVAAVTCRNEVRPEADPLTELSCEGDPGYGRERIERRIEDPSAYRAMSPHERRLFLNFNDVASAVRRSAWELHPFPRTGFGEDILMARGLLEAGHTVVHDGDLAVEHSHDYGPEELRARSRIDGAFNAEWLDRICVASRKDARTLTHRQLERDRAVLVARGESGAGLEASLGRAESLRSATFEGLWEGGQTPRRRPSTRALGSPRLKILYVVHGFPPETWAGTEVYTLNLARAVAARGHACTVLCRSPEERSVEDGGPPDFTVREDTFEGLRVLRMTHRIDHSNLRQSYAHPEGERVFRETLERERPDVVHFQHLLHFSAGMVGIARGLGIPTVITCNDYWALCARVQLIRPDGERCPNNMGLGCLWCVKEKNFDSIPWAQRNARWFKPGIAVLRAFGSLPKMPSVKLERIVRKRRIPAARRALGWKELEERQPYVLGQFSQADLCIAPSRFLRDRMLESGAFEAHRFVHSDYGLRTDAVQGFERRPDPQGRLRVGFIGSFVWYKGVDVLVRAMARVEDPRVICELYGVFDPNSDPYHAELAELAGPNVEFKGPFENGRLGEVHGGIDVLVVPSVWYENSPITIHEAWLTQTPTLVSDIGGMAELVHDGEDGLHFRVGDAGDLAAKILRLVEEPGLLEELSSARRDVKSIERNAAEMEYRYRGLRCLVRGAGGAEHPANPSP